MATDAERDSMPARDLPAEELSERDRAADNRPLDDRAPVARDAAATQVVDRPGHRHRAARLAGDAIVLDEDARLRQRERFGGLNWGAAFFGWLVATGLATILIAIVAAAGAAIGLTNGASSRDAGTIGIVGGALLIVILALSYYAGGYVAGRMSRFDGGRQGFGVWALGLILTALIGAAGAIFGSQYNVLGQLRLPRIPIDEGTLTTGGAVALAAVLLATLVASVAGGKLGQLYHRRVDREALVD